MLSTMIHPPSSNCMKESHILQVYLYAHRVFCQSIKFFKLVLKTSRWINTKKKQQRWAAAEGSVYRFERLFFALFETKKKKSLKMHSFGAIFVHPTTLNLLSLLLSISTFSHTRSVIIARETRNTVTKLFLQKRDNHKKLSSICFFYRLVTPQR